MEDEAESLYRARLDITDPCSVGGYRSPQEVAEYKATHLVLTNLFDICQDPNVVPTRQIAETLGTTIFVKVTEGTAQEAREVDWGGVYTPQEVIDLAERYHITVSAITEPIGYADDELLAAPLLRESGMFREIKLQGRSLFVSADEVSDSNYDVYQDSFGDTR